MCGIVAYTGFRNATPLLVEGLRRLEYRGYDSAGIAVFSGERFQIYKQAGKVSALAQAIRGEDISGTVGIAHTRWATHGAPTHANAHPHLSYDENVVLVHNGIIENHGFLRARLEKEGIHPVSETDTEILSHWIAWVRRQFPTLTWTEVIRRAFADVEGTFGVAMMVREAPNLLILVRRFSPLLIGLGQGEFIAASDATAVIPHTREVIHLAEDQAAILHPDMDEPQIFGLREQACAPRREYIDWDVAAIERGGYPHFMLKEIFEQPQAIRDCIRGRIRQEPLEVRLGGISGVMDRILGASRLTLVGCGTSWHAALVGKYLIEQLVQVPVNVEYASEFRYRDPVILHGDVVMGISQSGETADTLAALRMAKSRGALILGVTNVVGSSIPRETHAGIYIHAGPEIGVASTKAFTAQLSALTLFALHLGAVRYTIDRNLHDLLIERLLTLPDLVAQTLDRLNEPIKKLAESFASATNALYLGRGYNFPVALEGALKLKEISYIHAEGYPAAEMKHGPIALIDKNMPVVVIALRDSLYEKVLSNIQEVRARGGRVIAIATEGDENIQQYAESVFYIPDVPEPLSPILTVLPLQLLAYHTAVLRGCDVDQPRNLAKSVTVE
ncbi:MAG: glutamine--fructose-6-phosphate transaminase (isomerizing) [Bacteroidia bacterium]|nr:glutamine--fructose-6-phosphate transaminase (isomerizing) [Bacteroidia bacterium]MCX7652064.1 glutamine--fructose-6-phosphate transaminase (isomerizing) [Bacteroidia bacterium]MDW8416950.1 glutamine--fructose-6-phosphate transaminase (isomerizing) [Bacteroidia bacterium]